MKFMVLRKESNDPDHANKARKLALTRNFPLSDNVNLIIIEISDRPGHLNELLKSLIFFYAKSWITKFVLKVEYRGIQTLSKK